MGFTKLDSGITDSSIWSEPYFVRVVWVTMLAMANAEGRVNASLPGLQRRANVTEEECVKALDVFMAPDPYSRTPDNDGRRIEKVDGGWLILNHAKYREFTYSENPDAVRMRKLREKQKEQERTCSNTFENVQNVQNVANISASASVSSSDSGINTPEEKTIIYSLPFTAFWALYPKKVGKDAAWRAWQKLKLTQEDCTVIAAALGWQKKSEQWTRDGGQFIPHPSTYLNQGRWKDDPKVEAGPTLSEQADAVRRKYGF